MPTVLSDDTVQLLARLAIPFVDLNPESVVVRLAKDELARRSEAGAPATDGGTPEHDILDPDHPGSLTHTKVLSASINGEPMYKANWNGVLDRLHIIGRERLGSFGKLRGASAANLKEGKYISDGYRHLADVDLSIQGVDSNLAWSHSLGLARALGIPIEVKFMWREKEGSARPGEIALLRWEPKS